MKIAHKYLIVVCFLSTISSLPLVAAPSVNIGYHNPPNAEYGLNLLWAGPSYAFELGIGQMALQSKEATAKSDGRTDFFLVGDVNGKYFFGSGGLRPYAQLGIGAGVSGGSSGADAGAGGLFAGLGLFAGSEKFYMYLSGNIAAGKNSFVQVGVGLGV